MGEDMFENIKKISCPKCNGTGFVTEPVSIGKTLREMRLRAGWTLRQLADALDVSSSYLHDVEKGHRRIRNDRFAAAMEYLSQELCVELTR